MPAGAGTTLGLLAEPKLYQVRTNTRSPFPRRQTFSFSCNCSILKHFALRVFDSRVELPGTLGGGTGILGVFVAQSLGQGRGSARMQISLQQV